MRYFNFFSKLFLKKLDSSP